MTPTQILRKLESTRKAYSSLWDRLELLESDLDDEDDQDDAHIIQITGWDVSDMRDGLTRDIERIESAIKNFKKRYL